MKSPLISLCLLAAFSSAAALRADPVFDLARIALDARELAVVVNEDDPVSIKTGEYYLARRGIPPENLIRVHFPANGSVLPRTGFERLKAEVDRLTPAHIQAYALAWTRPYRVDCMSITSAFAFGFDMAYCSANRCGTTKPSPYFNSSSRAPRTDFGLRPAMMLAGRSFQEVKALIDRGIAADFTYPEGTGYLVNTSDKSRTVRAVFFGESIRLLGGALKLQRIDADAIHDRKDVLFYFTGLPSVPGLSSLRFRPGAVADHLTSTGGALTDSGQMSSLRWLEAGATGSYGTVVEPCNHLAKFPHPGMVMWRYAEGNTLIEAYWKSVAWPGEGVFVGEPLARPYGLRMLESAADHVRFRLFSPEWKNLRLEAAASTIGPYHPVEVYPVHPGVNEVRVHLPGTFAFYRMSP